MKESAIRNPQSAILRALTLWWAGVGLLAFWWTLLPSLAFAQSAIGGEMVEIYGTVQVEPGSNVLTIEVKGEEIRFAVHNLRSPDQRMSMARFLSDVRLREPGMFVRGPEEMLETLRKERPGKRVLRLRGIYYYDSRIFTLSGLDHVRETEKKQF